MAIIRLQEKRTGARASAEYLVQLPQLMARQPEAPIVAVTPFQGITIPAATILVLVAIYKVRVFSPAAARSSR